jgi:hypothetical protein
MFTEKTDLKVADFICFYLAENKNCRVGIEKLVELFNENI